MLEFHSLVDLASDAALAIGRRGRIVAWNERAADLLGYTSGEVIDRPCSEILQAALPSGELLCTPACEGARCFECHLPYAVADCSVRHKNGCWLRTSISSVVPPSRNEDGVHEETIAVVFLQPRDNVTPVPPSDGRLAIVTFDHFSLSVKGRALPTDKWCRKHALSLLKILVSEPCHQLHRDRLIEYLWPNANERRARARLKVTIHFLRERLRLAGVRGNIIDRTGSNYVLRNDRIWTDSRAFEELFNEAIRLKRSDRSNEALVRFKQAANLYRGDYLPEDLYADWCAVERERLREIYLDTLNHMVEAYIDSRDYGRAAEIARVGIAREPYREGFHRALMTCLAHLGQRSGAIAQYRQCRQILRAELGVDPSPETERLYRRLLAAAD